MLRRSVLFLLPARRGLLVGVRFVALLVGVRFVALLLEMQVCAVLLVGSVSGHSVCGSADSGGGGDGVHSGDGVVLVLRDHLVDRRERLCWRWRFWLIVHDGDDKKCQQHCAKEAGTASPRS